MSMPHSESDAAAIVAIEQVLARYCRSVDRLDADLLRSIFHPDAEIDLGSIYKGGVEGFLPVAMGFMGMMKATRHEITSVVVELDGREAGVEAYVTTWHRIAKPDGEVELVVLGRYLDRFELRDGRWAIRRHTEVIDWGAERPIDPSWFEGNTEMEKGARGAGDLSYSYLRRKA